MIADPSVPGQVAKSAGRRRRRFLAPVALVAMAALVVASWAGLSRLGLRLGSPPASLHGPLMVLGFLGTVISLERAVGLGRAWAWTAPVVAAAGTLLLLIGEPTGGLALLVAGGVALSVVYGAALRIGRNPLYLRVEALGALAWVAAAAALLAGTPVIWVAPSLGAFLVLTIVGERIELSRMAPAPSRFHGLVLGGGAAVLLGASVASIWVVGPASRLAGIALVVLAVAGSTADIARRTIRTPGVTRFMASSILIGYLWLAIAGLLWVAGAIDSGGSLYDPALHALFVGFVLSMIFAHAPVIVPAVAEIALPFHRFWWLALAVLHLTLAVRVAGSVFGANGMRVWGGTGNVVALGLFVLVVAMSVVKGRRMSR